MRTVCNSHDVVRAWAVRSQGRARNHKDSLSFEGNALYSYSTIIAMLHRTPHTSTVALVTSRTYSSTTSKQQGWAYGALHRAGIPAYTVPYVTQPLNDENLFYLRINYDTALQALRECRAHREPTEWELENPRRRCAELRNYNADFGIIQPEIDLDADIAAALAPWQERRAIYMTPEAAEKRLRRRAKFDLRRLVGV